MRHFKAEPLSLGTLQSRLRTALADQQHREVSLDEPGRRALKAGNAPSLAWDSPRIRRVARGETPTMIAGFSTGGMITGDGLVLAPVRHITGPSDLGGCRQ